MHKQLYKHYWPLLLPISLVLLLCIVLEPSWMTNDDAAMSMIAHGYGAIAEPSPKLVYSNILWGKFIQQLPTIGGMYGYSLATLLVISASTTCIMALLLKNTKSILLSSLVLALVVIQVTLFPQFTITAGLITVAGIIMLAEYVHRPHILWLIFASACIIIGYLIRREEAILICAVGLPFLPWRAFFTQARVAIIAALTAALIVGVTIIDSRAYDSPEWDKFQTLMPSVVPLVAFDAMPSLLERPDLLEKHKYTENDIKLIERWLWFDNEIASPKRLDALLSELDNPMSLPVLGNQPIVANWKESIKSSFSALLNKSILFIFLCSVLILLTRPSNALFTSWLNFGLALIVMGAIGRPGELRVYYPVMFLMIIAPLIKETKLLLFKKKDKIIIVTIIIAILTLSHTAVTVSASIKKQKISQKFRARLTNLPPKDQVIAGYYSSLKVSNIYSVTGAAKLNYNKLYLFGWPAVTPYSHAYKIDLSENSFQQRFMSPEGIWILINNEKLLAQYCLEKQGQLTHLVKAGKNTGGAKKLACVKS